MSRNITIGRVRFSYAWVFQPKKNRDDNGEERYSVTLLIPKTDMNSYNAVMACIEEAKQEGLNGDFKGAIPPTLAVPIHDGDGVKENTGEPYGPECKGHWVLTASNKIQPFVVDANIQPIIQQSAFYSGCYGMASIRFFPYAKGKKGIGCSLNGVQKLAEGEPLGGGISPEEAFRNAQQATQQGAWPNTPSGQTAYQQPTYQAPMQPTYQQAQYQVPPQPAYQIPQYQAPAQPGYPQIDPITGLPYTGGVMGI